MYNTAFSFDFPEGDKYHSTIRELTNHHFPPYWQGSSGLAQVCDSVMLYKGYKEIRFPLINVNEISAV